MRIEFVAGYGPIITDSRASRDFYEGCLAIEFAEEAGGYLHTAALDGAKHFALWPLEQAAVSCFGTVAWPGDVPVPTSWIEFDVDDVAAASDELVERGHRLLVREQVEPWGQTVTRLLSPEGLLVGITHTPHLREG